MLGLKSTLENPQIQVYFAGNGLLAGENGWPFRRFCGGGGGLPAPLLALARSSCAPSNASTPCPDPPRPISATPDRPRPSAVPTNCAATEQNGKKRPDEAESAGVLRKAAERHQRQRRSVAGSVLARPAQGRFEGPVTGPHRAAAPEVVATLATPKLNMAR